MQSDSGILTNARRQAGFFFSCPWRWLVTLVLSLVLSGCGPHPGAGDWIAEGEPVAGYQRLEVNFDGRAEFFAPGSEQAALRCFWAGDSASSIRLDCISAADDSTETRYGFRVLDKGGAGELLLDGKVLGRFRAAPVAAP
ncbi:MAG TPA: hypothetical protein ENK50_09750 [Sedimenticola sp.]|nr:hypothetical protein [Sedimenticola sp.]